MEINIKDRVTLNVENATSVGSVIRIEKGAYLPVVVKFDNEEEPFHFKQEELKNYENE